MDHRDHPALSLPLAMPGASPNEPTPSLQVIGRRGGGHLLLEIGLGLEAAGIVSFRRPTGAERP